MSDQSKLGLGQIITTEQHRDAIHVAVAPVKAGMPLWPGSHVELVDGVAMQTNGKAIGIVDPFLKARVADGETFWLFLYPGTITSLRHEWAHPAFDVQAPASSPSTPKDPEGESRRWMEKWAMEHMGYDCYGDRDKREVADAFADAIHAGHNLHIGPYESARDHIDDEWWNHWERLTNCTGQRGEYFSCAC